MTLVIGYHLAYPDQSAEGMSMRIFLIILMMSMFPLAYVDAAISTCREPMALFDKFGLQVLLMHSIFLTIRAITQQVQGEFDIFNNWQNIGGSFVSFIALGVGFHDQLTDPRHYRSVGILYGMALFASLVTVKLSPDLTFDFMRIIESISEYGEVLAFVPAALVIFSESKKDSAQTLTSEASKRRTLALSFFTVGFYFFEDMITMLLTAMSSRFESAAHLLHFALLVDFGVYVISYAFNPDGTTGTMLTRGFEAMVGASEMV